MANSQAALVGNLCADPIVRVTARGDTVVNLRVAVSEGTKDNPRTGFYDVTAWKDLARNCAESLTKGMRVVVTGVLQQDSWETKEGQTRTKIQVIADAVGPDLRWATAHVVTNTKPAVSPSQIFYPETVPAGAEDGLTYARKALNIDKDQGGAAGGYTGDWREEPF